MRLAGWKEAMPAIMRQAENEFQPLAQTYSAHQRTLVLLLDQMFPHKSMGKKDRAKLTDLILFDGARDAGGRRRCRTQGYL